MWSLCWWGQRQEDSWGSQMRPAMWIAESQAQREAMPPNNKVERVEEDTWYQSLESTNVLCSCI